MPQEQVAKRKGLELNEADLEALKQQVVDHFAPIEPALYHTAHLHDDGLIDPRDSRKVLSFALDLCREGARRQLRPSSFGVARG